MARRKQKYLSDGSDSEDANDALSDNDYDSQEDDDSRAERRLFERRQRKRPRTGRSGKDAAWEGIFQEGDYDLKRSYGAGLGSGRRAAADTSSRSDWTRLAIGPGDRTDTRAPTFVTGKQRADSKPVHEGPGSPTSEADKRTVSDTQSSEGSDTSEDDSRAASAVSPRVTDSNNDDTESRGPGIGRTRFDVSSFMSKGTASQGDGRASESESPSAFGRKAATFRDTLAQAANTERSNFKTSRSSTPTLSQRSVDLTKADKTHLSKVSGSFGASMLRKFGWTPGKGLGVGEDGRAVPIAVGMLNRGEGIKSGIRTEDSKREARRKGDIVDDEVQPGPRPNKGRKAERPVSDGWKRHKQVKVKVEHKTYEQLMAEDDPTRAGVGLVLDARGGELKAVESLSELSISGWTPTSDTSQLPELRHNLRLMLDLAKGSVGNLVKEGKSVNEQRRWTIREEERSRTKLETSVFNLERLRQIQTIVAEIALVSNQAAKSESPSLESLESLFDRLLADFRDEYVHLGLDEVVVGAIDMALKPAFASWQPFDVSSDALLSTLKPWRRAFNLEEASTSPDRDRVMTAWESFLWHRWLPKVRSAINNEWTPENPWPAVHLVESWDSLLPDFIRDNVLDQLVLPKVKDALESTSGRAVRGNKQASLASMLFPWLPLLGERHNELLEEGKRRIRAVLRRWKPSEGVPKDLLPWKRDIFTAHEWDMLMGECVLGKLGSTLRDLAINPRDQDLTAIVDQVMPWHSLIRMSNFTRLFELEFFPKWLEVLYLWLAHPGYNGEEVAQWFELWKSQFPPNVLQHQAISRGFEVGVKLMHDALALGSSAPKELQRPTYTPLSKTSTIMEDTGRARPLPRQPKPSQRGDITFRDIAADYISSKDLLMVPLGKSHATTGKPLFRVGKTVDGKRGVTIYVEEDAVFAETEAGVFRASTIEDVVKRAGGD